MPHALAALIALCFLLSGAQAASRDAQAMKFLAPPSQVNLNQMVTNPKLDGKSRLNAGCCSDPCSACLVRKNAASAASTPSPAWSTQSALLVKFPLSPHSRANLLPPGYSNLLTADAWLVPKLLTNWPCSCCQQVCTLEAADVVLL
jgi:hypothetical protein